MKKINKKNLAIIPFIMIIAISGMIMIYKAAKAATNAPQINRDLSVGAKGEDVKNLQKFLNSNGYKVASTGPGSPGKETDLFGNATKAALAKFQAANKITSSGYLGSKTRALLISLFNKTASNTGNASNSNNSSNAACSSVSSLTAENATLKNQIIALQEQVRALLAKQAELEASINSSDKIAPVISSIVIANNGDDGYIDVGDTIEITFNEAINPSSINSSLIKGGYVNSVSYNSTGGASITSSGVFTIRGIATFDVGSIGNTGNYTVKLALSSNGKTLTITLTSGNDVSIADEDFNSATQIGGTVKDVYGNEMENDSSISEPTGSFGGDSGDGYPRISSIKVNNGGDNGYIDVGDTIAITFSEEIDATSINNSLDEGDDVSNIPYSSTGGVSVSSNGVIYVNGIANFDIGSVGNTSNFTVKLALNSTGKILTITLTGGSYVEITDEDFDNAVQVGGIVEDIDGNEIKSLSSISVPTGTFGGDNDNDDDDNDTPNISAIKVTNGGSEGYIDEGDKIAITFDKAIDPKSIDSSLDEGGYVNSISYANTGGISVSSGGIVTIKELATFDMGSVESSGNFIVKLALNSTGKILTITLSSGNNIEIANESFNNATQIGGTVEDLAGNEMDDDSSISSPTGTFGGEN